MNDGRCVETCLRILRFGIGYVGVVWMVNALKKAFGVVFGDKFWPNAVGAALRNLVHVHQSSLRSIRGFMHNLRNQNFGRPIAVYLQLAYIPLV